MRDAGGDDLRHVEGLVAVVEGQGGRGQTAPPILAAAAAPRAWPHSPPHWTGQWPGGAWDPRTDDGLLLVPLVLLVRGEHRPLPT